MNARAHLQRDALIPRRIPPSLPRRTYQHDEACDDKEKRGNLVNQNHQSTVQSESNESDTIHVYEPNNHHLCFSSSINLSLSTKQTTNPHVSLAWLLEGLLIFLSPLNPSKKLDPFTTSSLTVSPLSTRINLTSLSDMGVPNDDIVVIQKPKKPGEAYMITINCPDKTGLGCDLCRIILDFGLSITKGDVSTDGKWCYIVLWVVPHLGSGNVRWASLKDRLMSVCPSCLLPYYFDHQSSSQSPPRLSPVYLLKFLCLDRRGLLYDVTKVLSELEFTIQRVKVMTTPDGKVLDLFFITDNMDLLHTNMRQDDTCEKLNAVLGESCSSCELLLAGPEFENLQQSCSTLAPEVADELFCCESSVMENPSQALSSDLAKLKKSSVVIDNSLSPAHTLFQIHCVDQKSLLYDIMRTLKDCNIQIAYGRVSSNIKGYRDIDLFIQQTDGKKIVDPEKQSALCSRLKVEMLHPLRVVITNRGPDTELVIANPVEFSGKGRPRVFYDVTLALKAEIGRHSTSDRQWEVYRFLLDENSKFPLGNSRARNQIVDRVRRTWMGW